MRSSASVSLTRVLRALLYFAAAISSISVTSAPAQLREDPPPPGSPLGAPVAANPIVGCYRWFNGAAVVIRSDHTMVGGPFTGSWQVIDSAKRAYLFTWPQPTISTVRISADQRSLSGGNQYGGKDTATRIAGSHGLVGTWRWFDMVASVVTINSDGTFFGCLVQCCMARDLAINERLSPDICAHGVGRTERQCHPCG